MAGILWTSWRTPGRSSDVSDGDLAAEPRKHLELGDDVAVRQNH